MFSWVSHRIIPGNTAHTSYACLSVRPRNGKIFFLFLRFPTQSINLEKCKPPIYTVSYVTDIYRMTFLHSPIYFATHQIKSNQVELSEITSTGHANKYISALTVQHSTVQQQCSAVSYSKGTAWYSTVQHSIVHYSTENQ